MTTTSATLDRNCTTPQPTERKRWSVAEVQALFELPFFDLVHRAQMVHRENFDPNAVQRSTLLSIKTGGCSEDCKYCPQSVHNDTGLEREGFLSREVVVDHAARSLQIDLPQK